MPYLESKDRKRLLKTLEPKSKGELNYLITVLMVNYIDRVGLNYQNASDAMAAATDAAAEFKDKVLQPYENLKMIQNGGIYTDITQRINNSTRAEIKKLEILQEKQAKEAKNK